MPPRSATDNDDPLHLRTAWHPLLILLLERLLPSDLWDVLPEYVLTREPRRIDAVIVRRVAAQAPDLRRALELVKEKDGRRFFLKNTAPNLAGAELADLVRAAIENNGGRITTSQNPGPRDEGRFRQLTVNVQFFATTPNLARILQALDTQVPYLVVDNMTIRPLNAFRGFKPAPGQEPENNVQLDVSALAYPDAPRPAAPPK